MMFQRKKFIQFVVTILLSVLYLNLNAKPHTFLKNSSIGLSYNNGIYLANSTFFAPNRYLTYRTRPSVYYGFGLNYYYQFKPHFSINFGYNLNLVKNSDRYDFRYGLLNTEVLNSIPPVLGSDNNSWFHRGVIFNDGEFKINLVSSHPLNKNLSIEFTTGLNILYSYRRHIETGGYSPIDDSTDLNFINCNQEINPTRSFSFGIVGGVDLRYSFKKAGALKLKVLFNGNVSKSHDIGILTLFRGTSVETSSTYIVNHSHIDFCLEYILPHLVKRKHKR